MAITYSVAVDLNDDGDYSDVGETLSADVVGLQWRLGMAQAYDTLGAVSVATVRMLNRDQNYSPEAGSLDLKPGHRLRIQSNDGTTTRTHFTGFIRQLEVMAGTQGKREAVIEAEGLEKQIAESRVRLPLQVDVSADTVIDSILDQCELRRPVLDGCLIVGVDGYNMLGNKLFGENVSRSLETGKSTFAYVADTWADGIPADRAIREVAASERGRFFFDREGQAVFYNRHHTLVDVTSLATFDDDMVKFDYAYGRDVVNRVQVTVIPRSIGAANTTLWELESAQIVPPKKEGKRQVVARFRDENDRPTGALEVSTKMTFSATTERDGTGEDVTDQIILRQVAVTASAVMLEMEQIRQYGTDRWRGNFYIQPVLQIKGTPLIQGDPMTLTADDQTSITFYGLQTLTLDVPTLTEVEDAQQMALYEVARRKGPRGRGRRLAVNTVLNQTQVLARTLFDRITVQESQTGHSGDYFIVAESHQVAQKGHEVEWLLEPADGDVYFVLDEHKPDGTHVLAY